MSGADKFNSKTSSSVQWWLNPLIWIILKDIYFSVHTPYRLVGVMHRFAVCQQTIKSNGRRKKKKKKKKRTFTIYFWNIGVRSHTSRLAGLLWAQRLNAECVFQRKLKCLTLRSIWTKWRVFMSATPSMWGETQLPPRSWRVPCALSLTCSQVSRRSRFINSVLGLRFSV